MQAVPEKRTSAVSRRTHLTLQQDYDHFVQAGSNIRNAKLYHNVIRRPLFNVPLELARTPYSGLVGRSQYVYTYMVISAGLSSWFAHHPWRVLPSLFAAGGACHNLDVAATCQGSHAGGSYERYAQAVQSRSRLEEELRGVKEEVANLDQLATHTLVQQLQNATGLPLFQHILSSLAEKKRRTTVLVCKQT